MNRSLDYIIRLNEGNFGATMRRIQAQTEKTEQIFGRIQKMAGGLFAMHSIGNFINESTQAAANLEAIDVRLQNVAGSQERYAQYNEFIRRSIKDLKLPMMETMDAFSAFAASTQNTHLEGTKTMQVFEGVSKAARALKLSGTQTHSVFVALEQMMSKGVVSSQELKLQLGNAMPGAFERAAEAMGMPIEAFTKALEKGEIKSEDFLVKFSGHLEKLYGPGVTKALDSISARITEANNNILERTAEVGERSSIVYLAWLDIKLKTIEAINWLVDVYDRYSGIINTVVAAVGTGTVLMYGYAAAVKAVALATTGAAMAKVFFTAMTAAAAGGASAFKAVMIALNATFAMNPIGVVVITLGTLIAAVVAAYHNFDWFSDRVDALWAIMKKGAGVIWEVLKGLGNMGQMLFYMATGQFQKASDAYTNMVESFISASNKAGEISWSFELDNAKANRQLIEFQETFDKAGMVNSVQLEKYVESTTDKAGKPYGFGNYIFQSATDRKKVEEDENNKLKTPDASASVSAGRSVRNVSVTIGSLINNNTIQATTIKEGVQDMKRVVQDALIRAVLDSEASL